MIYETTNKTRHKCKKNKYKNRTHLSEFKLKQTLKYFAFDLDAQKSSEMTDINWNTANRFYMLLREWITEICERDPPFPKGVLEADESYFGPRRVKGKRCREASKKTPDFWILNRGGKVYTEIVPDCSRDTLLGDNQG